MIYSLIEINWAGNVDCTGEKKKITRYFLEDAIKMLKIYQNAER